MIRQRNWSANFRSKTFTVGFLFVLLTVLWLILIGTSWSEAHASTSPNNSVSASSGTDKTGEEYSFRWLDPEKKITVLQNRKYLKSERLFISASGGVATSSAFRTAFSFDPRLSFNFSEDWGFEAFYTMVFNRENSTFQALRQAANVLPVVREIRAQYGAMIQYSPWYAKINVFNNILYFDWNFSAGAGLVHTALDTRATSSDSAQYVFVDRFAIFAATGQQFHLSHDICFRLDFTSAFYQAMVFGTSGAQVWWTNFTGGAGFGFRL